MEINFTLDHIIEILYLLIGLSISLILIFKSKKRISYIVTGVLEFTLIFSDAFRLIPKMLQDWNVHVNNYVEILGIGQIFISIISTLLFVVFYYVYKKKYPNLHYSWLDVIVYSLVVVKIVSSFVELGLDISTNASFMLGILNNTPLVLLAAIMIMLSYRFTKSKDDITLTIVLLTLSLYKVVHYIYIEERVSEVHPNVLVTLTPVIVIFIVSVIYFINKSKYISLNVKMNE